MRQGGPVFFCATLYNGLSVRAARADDYSRLWTVFVKASVSSSPLVELHQLQAYTSYSVYVEACTVGGCTRGPATSLTTSTDLPVDLSAALVHNITSTSVQLTWSDPRLPNGRILRWTATLVQCSRAVISEVSRSGDTVSPVSWSGGIVAIVSWRRIFSPSFKSITKQEKLTSQ